MPLVEWWEVCNECEADHKWAGHTGAHNKRCPSMRGGRRSKIRCEQVEGHVESLHWGRGDAGQWFTWGLSD